MANEFSKEERIAWATLIQGFDDQLVLSRLVAVQRTDSQSMERSNNTLWMPAPYIAQSFSGVDQTTNFQDNTQLTVPHRIDLFQSVPWLMSTFDLLDIVQTGRINDAGYQKLASDVNLSCMDVAAEQGTLVVKRTNSATGYDDVAQIEAIMNEQGVGYGERYFALSTRDYNGMADNLAERTLGNSLKSLAAYEESYIGKVASFKTYKLDYANSLDAFAATGVVINGANQFYVPRATEVTGTGIIKGTNNVDNRTQTINVTVGAGLLKVGDAFTVAGVDAVHHVTKRTTGQLKTFRITDLLASGGATGAIEISPPFTSGQGGDNAELQYKNITATPADAAVITFLNTTTAAVNPFWRKDAIKILPGRIGAIENSGAQVLRGSTEQGFELMLTKFFEIDNLQAKYRIDVRWGVTMTNPEMAGIMLFSQA